MAKVLLSIEDNLLKRVDRTARARGLTRSGYLAELARRDLAAGRGPGAEPETRAALARLDALFARNDTPGDATRLVREERDRR